jgi:hypothetical protein
MVCGPEAINDLTQALGAATTPTAPTWADHVYSCNYIFPDGTMTVSVKELSNRATTSAYFAGLRTQLGEREALSGVAQGAADACGVRVASSVAIEHRRVGRPDAARLLDWRVVSAPSQRRRIWASTRNSSCPVLFRDCVHQQI